MRSTGAREGKDIVEGELAFGGDHLFELRLLLAIDVWRLQDTVDQLPGDKAGVVPFPVVAHAKVEDIDILVAIAWIDVKEEKAFNRMNSTTSNQTESTSVSERSMTTSVARNAAYMATNSPG